MLHRATIGIILCCLVVLTLGIQNEIDANVESQFTLIVREKLAPLWDTLQSTTRTGCRAVIRVPTWPNVVITCRKCAPPMNSDSGCSWAMPGVTNFGMQGYRVFGQPGLFMIPAIDCEKNKMYLTALMRLGEVSDVTMENAGPQTICVPSNTRQDIRYITWHTRVESNKLVINGGRRCLMKYLPPPLPQSHAVSRISLMNGVEFISVSGESNEMSRGLSFEKDPLAIRHYVTMQECLLVFLQTREPRFSIKTIGFNLHKNENPVVGSCTPRKSNFTLQFAIDPQGRNVRMPRPRQWQFFLIKNDNGAKYLMLSGALKRFPENATTELHYSFSAFAFRSIFQYK